MNSMVALIVMISAQGYWLGGTTGQVTLTWPAGSAPPAAFLGWDLMLGPTRLTGGRVDVPDARKGIRLSLTPPEVRARTALRFVYRLTGREGGTDLAAGTVPLHIFPNERPANLEKRYAGRHVVLIDTDDRLQKLLNHAGVASTIVADASAAGFLKPDFLLIAADTLPASPYQQPDLQAMAASGVQVVVFRQTKPLSVAGLVVTSAARKPKIAWRLDHPLLQDLDEVGLTAWASLGTAQCVALPADRSALELGWWQHEPALKSGTTVPTDAVLMTQTIGKGRIIVSQLPTLDWSHDARGSIFMNNVLDFLLTPSVPTPRPAERAATVVPQPTTRHEIKLSPGALP